MAVGLAFVLPIAAYEAAHRVAAVRAKAILPYLVGDVVRALSGAEQVVVGLHVGWAGAFPGAGIKQKYVAWMRKKRGGEEDKECDIRQDRLQLHRMDSVEDGERSAAPLELLGQPMRKGASFDHACMHVPPFTFVVLMTVRILKILLKASESRRWARLEFTET